uniref:Uncharacterized protein n=1 Tax=Moniliophthora roreri TaxID=221103 RepID=A0A0W0GBU3_MONRR
MQLNKHDYSPPPPHVQHLLLCPDQEPNNLIPPLFPIMNNDSSPPTNSTPLMNRLTPEHRSVWDDEDINEEPEELLPSNGSRSPMQHTMERMEEVFERLCALCADWRNTAPLTAGNEGLEELRSITIPSAIQLLTTILQTISPGMMRSMETENPERRELPPRPVFVVDIREEEGPRYFYRVNSPQFQGEWLHMGQPIMSVDAQA